MRVPDLQEGEVLLCEPYPYRTVTNTARTVYQMARLGFSSVSSFQQAHDLKADGIIGPLTQQRTEAEFARRFGQSPSKGSKDAALSLSVQPVATVTGLTASVTIRAVTGKAPRVVGRLTHDEARGFQFSDPSVTLGIRTCSYRAGGLVVCGGSSVSVALSQAEALAGSASLPPAGASESRRLDAVVTYLDADLTERVTKSHASLPGAHEK